MRRTRPFAFLLAATSFLGPGCVVKPPILLETTTPPTRAKTLPFKVGVNKVNFADAEVSNCATWQFTLIIPAVQIYAKFPNVRDESLYVRDAILTYLRDVSLFKYTYNAPFDPGDVDYVADIELTDFEFGNGVWGKLMGLANGVPLVGPIAQIILPQEHYHWRFGMKLTLSDRNGNRVKSYTAAREGADNVWFIEQPWGNYLWYEGPFKRDFVGMLEEIRKQVEGDPPR